MEQPKNNLKIVTDKKTNARVILPNMLTLIGVCIGLSSIRFALDGKFEFAIIAIMFAALIDGLDGRIARLIKGTSKVGKELDSLTDMISFGVAPAFIMYFWKLNTLGRFGWLLCLIYVICVALRLARFNVNTGQAPSWRDNFFEGVPSPAGGILVLTPLIFSLTNFNFININYDIDKNLVRGLDYYCHTAFEFTTNELGSQGTVLAGGRYDGLRKQSDRDRPAVGFDLDLVSVSNL